MPGFLAQWHHQAHEISFGQQLVEAAKLCAQFLLQCGLAAVAAVQDGHVETQATTTGNGCADITHADNAQGLAVHIAAKQGRRHAGLPLACLGPGVQLGDPTCAAHDQGKTQVGGAFSQHVRGIGEHDAAFVEVVDIVVVVTHRDAGHHFQLTGIFQLLAPQFAADADQTVGVGQCLFELGVDIAQLGVGRDDVEILLQALDHLGGDAAEGKYGFLGAGKAHLNKTHRLSGM